MSIQTIMATILERELAARGVQSLRHSDCMEIVESLIVRLKELDRELVARNGRDGPGQERPGRVMPGPFHQPE
jgi:hypothetical protein